MTGLRSCRTRSLAASKRPTNDRDLGSALAHSRKSLAIYETLQNLDATNAANQFTLVLMYNQIGEALEKMKNGRKL
jgi:hypothetical protein